MPHIRITNRTWDETMTTTNNLTMQSMTAPAIRDVIEYTEPRAVSTLIVAGAKNPWDTVGDRKATKVGLAGKDGRGTPIGSLSYRFRKMGRIQMASTIDSLIQASTTDGQFVLKMKDSYLYEGMIVQFYDETFQARVQTNPEGSDETGYTVHFESVNGQPLDYTNMIAAQAGEKTCWGGYTAYEEKSLRGYSRLHYPDEFINHMTTQRKSFSMSGDAMTQVLWYQPTDKSMKAGWRFERERQHRIQMLMESEFQRWFGRSTMIDEFGNLRPQSKLKSKSTGEFVTIGMGVTQQIEGENDGICSGANGAPVLDDFKDMITTLNKNKNTLYGNHYYVVTGSEGYSAAQDVLAAAWQSTGGRYNQTNKNSMTNGDDAMAVNYHFDTFNYSGSSLTFVQHPLFDNEQIFTKYGFDGANLMSGTYYFIDSTMQSNGLKNIEILTKSAMGINRSMVEIVLNGITGFDAPAVTEEDAIRFAMLKQDMFNIYNTSTCGILRRAA